MITKPGIFFAGSNLSGKNVSKIYRKLKDLKGIFLDQQAYAAANPEELVYEVETYCPVADGTEGGLFFGITKLYSGMIGNEYYLTKGHFHQIRNRAEFYWCIEGEGALLMMNGAGETRAESMMPGSLHYIDADTAHRVANMGKIPLIFGAVWPADAGHDYDTIVKSGFSKRLVQINNEPALI